MIDALDLREYVVWLGHIDNVASAYKAFDLTLMPSEYEGLPNVCIESLICATPVIAFNVDGINEVLSDGINGRIIERGDQDKFNEIVYEICSDSKD